MLIRVIDLETTGTDPEEGAEIIEIAGVDVLLENGQGQIIKAQSSFVRPENPIPPETSAIHHIIDDDVKGAMPWSMVRMDYVGADAYCAHNAKFERSFVDPLRKSDKPWICTYKLAMACFPDAPTHSNQGLRYLWGIHDIPGWATRAELNQAHRALPDTLVTAMHLIEFAKRYSFEEMVRISNSPILLSKIRFGKYAGERWSDLPDDYLSWMSDKGGWDEDVAHTLACELKRRREGGPGQQAAPEMFS